MALIKTSEGHDGVILPVWFLGAATAAFLATSVIVGGAAISTWAKADSNAQKNSEQDKRLDNLEQLRIDVAGMKSDVATTKDLAKATNDKLDRLIDTELGQRHNR